MTIGVGILELSCFVPKLWPKNRNQPKGAELKEKNLKFCQKENHYTQKKSKGSFGNPILILTLFVSKVFQISLTFCRNLEKNNQKQRNFSEEVLICALYSDFKNSFLAWKVLDHSLSYQKIRCVRLIAKVLQPFLYFGYKSKYLKESSKKKSTFQKSVGITQLCILAIFWHDWITFTRPLMISFYIYSTSVTKALITQLSIMLLV